MNKVLILTLTCILTPFLTYSQICKPDRSISKPGFYPSKLDDAVAGDPYTMTIQFKVLKDTLVDFMGSPVRANIDSIKLLKANGLPSGFSFNCSKSTCSYRSDSIGCAVIEGTPLTSQVGKHPLDLIVIIYAKIFSFPVTQNDTIRNFVLNVNSTAGFIGQNSRYFSVLTYPNPVKNDLFIKNLTLLENEKDATLKVFGMDGQVYRTFLLKTGGENQPLDVSGLSKGIYWVEIQTEQGLFREKIFKE